MQIKRLFAYPESNQISIFKNKKDNPELYISLASDLSQQLSPQTEQRGKGSPAMMPSTLKVGGLPFLSTYLTTLRAKIEKESNMELLSIAMGDSIPVKEMDKKKINIITQVLKELNLDLIHLGHNESIWVKELESLKPQEQSQQMPSWINSNIFSIKTGRPLENGGSLPFSIKSVGSTSIGIMALTSYHSLPKEKKKDLNGIYYQDPLTAILRTKNLLKSKNVHLNILLYQGNIPCSESIQDTPISFDQIKEKKCLKDKELEIYQLISKLPPKTIDLIITSSSQATSSKVQGIPLLGLPKPKSFLSLAKIVIDDNTHQILFEDSYILPPLKICHKVFAGLEDCILNAPTEQMNEKRFDYLENTAFGLIPSKFLGNQIIADKTLEDIINGK